MDIPPPDMTSIIIADMTRIATTPSPPIETGSNGEYRELTKADRIAEALVYAMLAAVVALLVFAIGFAIWVVSSS